jgi:branched-chain amino acid transport system permease protein
VEAFQYLVSGLSVGSVYALVAIGFVVIYSVTGIINFAQGEFVMLGGMLSYFFWHSLNFPMVLAAVLSILLVIICGLLLERLAINSNKKAAVISLIIITIGASMLLRGIAGELWGKDAVATPTFSTLQSFSLFGVIIQTQTLWIVGTTLILAVGIELLLSGTILGKAFKACSLNPRAAGIIGINVRTMSLFSFGIAAALGAIGGLVISPLSFTSYDTGVMLGLKGFVAAAMGGMTNLTGAVISGFVLGLLESFGAGYISSAYKDAIALLIFFVFLLIQAKKLMSKEVED